MSSVDFFYNEFCFLAEMNGHFLCFTSCSDSWLQNYWQKKLQAVPEKYLAMLIYIALIFIDGSVNTTCIKCDAHSLDWQLKYEHMLKSWIMCHKIYEILKS